MTMKVMSLLTFLEFTVTANTVKLVLKVIHW